MVRSASSMRTLCPAFWQAVATWSNPSGGLGYSLSVGGFTKTMFMSPLCRASGRAGTFVGYHYRYNLCGEFSFLTRVSAPYPMLCQLVAPYTTKPHMLRPFRVAGTLLARNLTPLPMIYGFINRKSTDTSKPILLTPVTTDSGNSSCRLPLWASPGQDGDIS